MSIQYESNMNISVLFWPIVSCTPPPHPCHVEDGVEPGAIAVADVGPVQVDVTDPPTSADEQKSAPEDVQFSVEDEKSKEKETGF